MKLRTIRWFAGGVLAVWWAGGGTAQAQFTGNNQTNLISGVSSNWPGDYYVGSNTLADVLVVNNHGVLNNNNGYLGYAAGSSNNAVLITDAGSVWSNASLYVGWGGAGNRLTISNGGTVYNAVGYIGAVAGASNNAVTVTGIGSVWSNSNLLYVGQSGAGNTLTIASGGTVSSSGGTLGMSSGANNNRTLVTDSGSVWNNNNSVLMIGSAGAGNALTVANGGTVTSLMGYIGNSPGASNNAVTITGAGAVWTNGGSLYVGYSGAGSALLVSNGGTVYAQQVTVGANAIGGINNALTVAGGTLNASNGVGAAVDVRRGAVLLSSGALYAHALLLTNGASGTYTQTGGTLAVNTFTSGGAGNVQLLGGTLGPLNANGNWSANLLVSNTVTLNTADLANQARTNLLSGALSGSGTLNLVGAGLVNLNGTATGGGWINAYGPATLGGTGALQNVHVLAGAVLAPGLGVGTLTATNLLLDDGAHVQLQLNALAGVAGTDWDLMQVNGPALLNGISSVNPLILDTVNFGGINGAQDPLATERWTLLTATAGVSGFASNAFTINPTGFAGWAGTWSVESPDSNTLQLVYTAVPEPNTFGLIVVFGGGLVGWRRLRR